MSNDERRAFSRIQFDADTNLHQGDHSWSVVMADISLKGLLIEEPFAWHIDEKAPLEANIRLGDDCKINMLVEFRHQENKLVGFECIEIDIDSISHLRRLVELNLGDPQLLERELAALGG